MIRRSNQPQLLTCLHWPMDIHLLQCFLFSFLSLVSISTLKDQAAVHSNCAAVSLRKTPVRTVRNDDRSCLFTFPATVLCMYSIAAQGCTETATGQLIQRLLLRDKHDSNHSVDSGAVKAASICCLCSVCWSWEVEQSHGKLCQKQIDASAANMMTNENK